MDSIDPTSIFIEHIPSVQLFLAGLLFCILLEFIFLCIFCNWHPFEGHKNRLERIPFCLPQEIENILQNPDVHKSETCLCLNMVLQFLFQEVKERRQTRRWLLEKLNREFFQVLVKTQAAKVINAITMNDFSLGTSSPVIRNVTLHNVSLNDDNTIEEVTLLLDMTYDGRLQFSVRADLIKGWTAYLSLTFSNITGLIRLQFSQKPCSHWSFTFVKEPKINVEIETQFQGKPVPKFSKVVHAMVRRLIRKKHTLPVAKMRYMPCFRRPRIDLSGLNVFRNGERLSMGLLKVTVIDCTRLAFDIRLASSSVVYCTLALGHLPWHDMLMHSNPHLWTPLEFHLKLRSGRKTGLILQEKFIVEKRLVMVVITGVVSRSAAFEAGLRKNDILVEVNNKRVASVAQARNVLDRAKDSVILKIERQVEVEESTSQISLNSSTKHDDSGNMNDFSGLQSKPITPLDFLSAKLSTYESDPDDELFDKASLVSKNSIQTGISSTYEPYQEFSIPTNQSHVEYGFHGKKTADVQLSPNPVFDEKFEFDVTEEQRFLNICVWRKTTEKRDKENRVIKHEKEDLIGYTSIELMTVATECLSTLQGNFTDTYPLQDLCAHIMNNTGPQCTDVPVGDITVQFQHHLTGLPWFDIWKIQNIKNKLNEWDIKEKKWNNKIDRLTPYITDRPPGSTQGSHNFALINITRFPYCDFCLKKILGWTAFLCNDCGTLCHKSCTAHCQNETICTPLRDASLKLKISDNSLNYAKIGLVILDGLQWKTKPDTNIGPSESSTPQDWFSESDSTLDSEITVTDIEPAVINKKKLKKDVIEKMKLFATKWNLRVDDPVFIAAVDIGNKLFAHVDPQERKKLLKDVIDNFKPDLELYSKNFTKLTHQLQVIKDQKKIPYLLDELNKTNTKLQSLGLVLLHYKAGILHCRYLGEKHREKQRNHEQRVGEVFKFKIDKPQSRNRKVANHDDAHEDAVEPSNNETIEETKRDKFKSFIKKVTFNN